MRSVQISHYWPQTAVLWFDGNITVSVVSGLLWSSWGSFGASAPILIWPKLHCSTLISFRNDSTVGWNACLQLLNGRFWLANSQTFHGPVLSSEVRGEGERGETKHLLLWWANIYICLTKVLTQIRYKSILVRILRLPEILYIALSVNCVFLAVRS